MSKIPLVFLLVILVNSYCFGETNTLESVKQPPFESQSLIGKGMQYVKEKKYEEAAEAFEEYIRECPDIMQGYISLAAMYNLLGEHYKAIEVYKKGIKELPNDAWYLYANMAGEYNLLGRYSEAIGICSQAIEFKPEAPFPSMMLGNIYFASGEKQKAETNFKLALEKAQKVNDIEAIKQIEYLLSKIRE